MLVEKSSQQRHKTYIGIGIVVIDAFVNLEVVMLAKVRHKAKLAVIIFLRTSEHIGSGR